jgi:hypothetical protein
MTEHEIHSINQILKLVLEIKINMSSRDIADYELSEYDIDNLITVIDLIKSLFSNTKS